MAEARISSETGSRAELWLVEYGDYLYRCAARYGVSTSVCEDLVQETLLAGMLNYPKFRQESPVKHWLASILRHKVADHFRRCHRETPTDQAWGPEEGPEFFNRWGKWVWGPRSTPTVEEQFDFRHLMTAVSGCLNGLNERSRNFFLLAEFDGFAPHELASLFGLSQENLRVILHRARLKLRNCLEKAGVAL
ncbi:sigma-70 family RNA polymerase sigma factor [bacterium]|nr:sigma-70 family RNA polymerase sigma factor [bacterium]